MFARRVLAVASVPLAALIIGRTSAASRVIPTPS
jgi:hypothetical protein